MRSMMPVNFTTIDAEKRMAGKITSFSSRKKLGEEIELEFKIQDSYGKCKIHKMLLQPFVENAIVHGIAEKPDIESCEIRICARREEQDIVFSVQDDGPGVDVKEMQKETQQDIRTAQHGYGVRNINFRLKLCFGEKYGVTYLESEKGTHVEIKIPVMTMAEAEEKI